MARYQARGQRGVYWYYKLQAAEPIFPTKDKPSRYKHLGKAGSCAHRYIPQKCLKILGATWHPDTINPMLALRVIRANDWWPDFWHQISLEKNQPISCY